MQGALTFDGPTLVQSLAGLSPRVSRSAQKEALLDGGEPLRRRVSQHTRRAPGLPDLADNIHIGGVRSSDPDEVSVGIGVPRRFFYDWFLEYGTVRMSAFPMYRPAFDEMVQSTINAVGAAMWRELAGRGIHRPAVSSGAALSGLV